MCTNLIVPVNLTGKKIYLLKVPVNLMSKIDG